MHQNPKFDKNFYHFNWKIRLSQCCLEASLLFMKFFQNEGFHVNGKRNNTSLLVERHDPKIKSDFEQERQVPLKNI